jgi:hypothetical protein
LKQLLHRCHFIALRRLSPQNLNVLVHDSFAHTPQASEPQTPSTRAHIGILVVAYNAESTLRSVLERIPPAVLAKIEEIVVFDDASQDRTFEVGESLQDRFRGVKLSIYRATPST